MKNELAKKMDALMDWNVLDRPENIGVTVEFCSPSMLVPKTEKGQFRLVTDFSALNRFIKKYPTVSPTIQDAKEDIANAKYIINLDLSNYFYQGGMSRHDASYLGVVHPYKGLLVYVSEPQDLKNASKHSQERLVRILGEMIQAKKVTTMADGVHVLAQDFDELYSNFQQVLTRFSWYDHQTFQGGECSSEDCHVWLEL